MSLCILQVNSADIAGGAEKISLDLHHTYMSLGYKSWLIVGYKNSTQNNIIKIQNIFDRDWLNRGTLKENKIIKKKLIRYSLRLLTLDWRAFTRWMGIEDFYYPESRHIVQMISEKPDVVHAHNLHGGYFDLGNLPHISKEFPCIITLHDEWLYTGHCAHSILCDRWRSGCGKCPDLARYPEIPRDATAINWLRKRKVFSNSRLYITAPSQWLLTRARSSILNPLIARLIPNGVDQTVFKPGNQHSVRENLNLPDCDFILLFVKALVQNNPYKDYTTIMNAIDHLEIPPGRQVTCVALGGGENTEFRGNIRIIHVPFQKEPQKVANYYCAADICLYAAKADTFPNVILESLACGTPVIATAIGGIPEQIIDGKTGFLVAPGQPMEMATKINLLIGNPELLHRMSYDAAEDARLRFSLDREVKDYLDFYSEVIDDWKRHKQLR